MTVAGRDLVDAIESTLHFYPPPGLADALDVPGVKGRVSQSSHPPANFVGMARLDAANAMSTRMPSTPPS